jgi:hypothetical protein
MEQRFLLQAEGVRFKGRRVDMAVFEHHFARRRAVMQAKFRGRVVRKS